MANEDTPPDDLRNLRDNLRMGSEVAVQLTKIEMAIAELKGEAADARHRGERSDESLNQLKDDTKEIKAKVYQINGTVAQHDKDLIAVKVRLAAVDLKEAEERGYRDGRATAFVSWSQWKVLFALVGGTAALASIVAAAVNTLGGF